MADFKVVHEFAKNLSNKLIDMDSDTIKAVLTLTAPTQAGSAVLADLTQIAGTGGYAPVTLTSVAFTETGSGTGIWELTSDPIEWTATGADFASARYMALYSDTSTGDCLIGFMDLGAFTLADTFTLTINPTDGFLEIAVSA